MGNFVSSVVAGGLMMINGLFGGAPGFTNGAIQPPLYGYSRNGEPVTPDTVTPDYYKARVYTGEALSLEDEKLYDLGGTGPHIKLYDRYWRGVANDTWGQRIEDGSFWDYNMAPRKEGVNPLPEYVSVEFNQTDSICVSAIVLGAPDGHELIITGDLVHSLCHWPGYPSRRRITIGDSDVAPFCIFAGSLGRDGPNSATTLAQVHTFHLPSFMAYKANSDAYKMNKELLCNAPPRAWPWGHWPSGFPVFDPPLTWPDDMSDVNGTYHGQRPTAYDEAFITNASNWKLSDGKEDPKFSPLTGIPELGLAKRGDGVDASSLHRRMAKAIIAKHHGQYSTTSSSEARYSAEAICGNPGSAGPDWENTYERKYCDLSTNTVYEFCESVEQGFCWDEVEKEIRGERSPFVARRVGDEGVEFGSPPRAEPIKKLKTLRWDFGDMKLDRREDATALRWVPSFVRKQYERAMGYF